MYDLIVIGAGAIGSATAFHAAKAGRKVLLLEQYAIDHQRGSSYGYSRIIRYAYDHPVYVRLMQSAFPAWRALEEESGESLYVRTGGIDFALPSEPLFVKMLDSLAEVGIAHEVWSAAEAEERFPQFRLDDGMVVLYQEDAGLLRASRAVQTFVRLAREHGADVQDNTPVTAIRPTASGVEVSTSAGVFAAEKLVIASGAWLKPMLAPLGLELPLQPVAAQENYFNALDPLLFEPERFPVFIGHLQAEYGNILYGLPAIDGSGVKIGLHSGPPIDPESPSRAPDLGVVERMTAFARLYIPQAVGSLASTRVCLYTLTPDEHFIVDCHPTYPQVVIASCCSGHGFKFSPLLGQILSDLALTGTTRYDLDLFRLSRFS